MQLNLEQLTKLDRKRRKKLVTVTVDNRPAPVLRQSRGVVRLDQGDAHRYIQGIGSSWGGGYTFAPNLLCCGRDGSRVSRYTVEVDGKPFASFTDLREARRQAHSMVEYGGLKAEVFPI